MSFQEFQKKANRLTPLEIGIIILAVIVLGLVVVGLAVANNYFAPTLQDGGELYLLRTGGRSFLYDHIEPYSGSVATRVQEQVYGRSAQSGEDLYILDVPFYLLLLFFPLAVFPDALIARAFWMAIAELSLVGSMYLGLRLLNRQIPAIFGVLLFAAGLTSYYAYISFVEGSPAILLGLVYLGLLLAFRNGQDELAGALMLVASFHWEMGGPLLLFVLFVVFKQRRWRVLAGAGMLGFILLAFSFFLYPGWIMPFLRASWNSFRAGFGFSTLEILMHLWPEYGRIAGWTLVAVLIVALGYEWGAAWKANQQRFTWAACFTLAATPLLGFHVELDQLVVLTIPLMLVVVLSRERWRKIGSGLVVLLVIFFFGLPWYIFAQGLPWQIDLTEGEFMFLFWPVFAVLGLYWVRWWMIRPPRTWLDQELQTERSS